MRVQLAPLPVVPGAEMIIGTRVPISNREPVSLKRRDKGGRLLRLECTVNDATLFAPLTKYNLYNYH